MTFTELNMNRIFPKVQTNSPQQEHIQNISEKQTTQNTTSPKDNCISEKNDLEPMIID